MLRFFKFKENSHGEERRRKLTCLVYSCPSPWKQNATVSAEFLLDTEDLWRKEVDVPAVKDILPRAHVLIDTKTGSTKRHIFREEGSDSWAPHLTLDNHSTRQPKCKFFWEAVSGFVFVYFLVFSCCFNADLSYLFGLSVWETWIANCSSMNPGAFF